jgi:hypothetical protein
MPECALFFLFQGGFLELRGLQEPWKMSNIAP